MARNRIEHDEENGRAIVWLEREGMLVRDGTFLIPSYISVDEETVKRRTSFTINLWTE